METAMEKVMREAREYCDKCDIKYNNEEHIGVPYYILMKDRRFHKRYGNPFTINGTRLFSEFVNGEWHITSAACGALLASGNTIEEAMTKIKSIAVKEDGVFLCERIEDAAKLYGLSPLYNDIHQIAHEYYEYVHPND